jgi:hypothetical protein
VLRFIAYLIAVLSLPIAGVMAQGTQTGGQTGTPPAKAQDIKDFKLDKPAPSQTGPADPEPSKQPSSTVKPAGPQKSTAAQPNITFQPNTAPRPTAPKATESKPTTTAPVVPKPAPIAVKPAADKEAAKKTTAAAAATLAVPVVTETPNAAAGTPVAPGLPLDPAASSTAGSTAAPGVDTVLTPDANETVADPSNTPSPEPEPKASNGADPIMPALIGAGVVSVIGMLMWLWSRRRRAVANVDEANYDEASVEQDILEAGNAPEPQPEPMPEPAFAATPIATPVEEPIIEPVIETAPAPAPASEPEPEPEPELVQPVMAATPSPVTKAPAAPASKTTANPISLSFAPERIVISFNSLTLYGDLIVENSSDSAITDIKLMAALMTANANQNAEMAAFHAGDVGMDADPIDDMAAAEKIGLSLALVLPLAELQSYSHGEQVLTAPIMLARLAFTADKADYVQTLSCIIGREAEPPQAKMGPLRLDLGPRSYGSLGQRAIAA